MLSGTDGCSRRDDGGSTIRMIASDGEDELELDCRWGGLLGTTRIGIVLVVILGLLLLFRLGLVSFWAGNERLSDDRDRGEDTLDN